MKNTIIIPTDFTVQSLNVLKTVLTQNHNKEVYDIILLHSLSVSDSIRDLLFSSKHQQINALMNPEFAEAYEVIRNKFNSQISSLRIDLFTGYNLAAFKNYVEANKVEKIFIANQFPENCSSESRNLYRFIQKCGKEILLVATGNNNAIPEKGKIAEVFVNQVSLG